MPVIHRRSFLLSPFAFTAAAREQPPNIVLILADDLGWSDLGCYGADLHETPNLDRLARQGARFTHAFSSAPICSPTRAAIMTGKHPVRLGMTIWREGAIEPATGRKLTPPRSEPDLALTEVTIAERLQSAGYLTAAVGKWHLGDPTTYPEAQGFDINIGGTHWGAPQSYFAPYRAQRNARELRYVPGLPFPKPGEYLTDRLTGEAVNIVHRAAGRPFFLYLAHHAPHTPIQAKEDKVEKYRRKLRDGMRHKNAAYAAMVESLDESVGRVLAALEERKLAANTLVIFTSDNGGYINPFQGQPVTNNAPLRSGKGSLYDGGIRVPLIVRWPGVATAGSTVPDTAVSHDLFATIEKAAGLSSTAVDGIDLSPLLRDASSRLSRDALFFHYPHYYPTTTPVSAIRTRQWKLLQYFEDNHLELYDLDRDPAEQHDLASQRPDVARDLLARLEQWRTSVGARLPSGV